MTVPQSQDLHYPGNELHLFAEASNWKSYVGQIVQPYLGDRVLEVGAGIGGMTRYLNSGIATEWVCLEPDSKLLAQLQGTLLCNQLPENCLPVHGTLTDLKDEVLFDSILYMDVIEHIDNDKFELQQASQHLAPGGSLIVLSPAHQFLYSPFDRAIGHYRRYSKRMMHQVSPEKLALTRLAYLDSVGLLASLANFAFLRQETPSIQQVKLWDNYLVACSRWIDPLLLHSVGKSILAVWTKPAER